MSLAVCMTACGGMGPMGGKRNSPDDTQEPRQTEGLSQPDPAEAPQKGRKFQEPAELDKLLDAKPIALAVVKTTQSGGMETPAASKSASQGKGRFRIQISAESDVDAAQAKKRDYERQLGGSVDVVFDAPYYKLRWGFFETKQEAEDKLLEISDQVSQGFVIKQ